MIAPDTRTITRTITRSFTRFVAAVVAYDVLVILFGAWVRITGSGAGCGDHWPTCHGQLLPRAPSVATVIEFTHRVTSSLSLVLAVILVVWARRIFPSGHTVRRAAWGALIFVSAEAALGALLVLRGLVAVDASVERAVVVGLHLVNTYGLLGCCALCWLASSGMALGSEAWPRRLRSHILGVVALLLLIGATGAVTALGDTLFPIPPASSGGLLAHVSEGLSSGQHFLVRLRVLHPVVAVVGGALLLVLAVRVRRSSRPTVALASDLVFALVFAQWALGAANIWLGAPGWMQLAHLALADLLWMTFVVLAAELRGEPD